MSHSVSLRDYVDTRFDGIEKAISLARENLETRLEGLNEWRQQSKDREAAYTTRSELNLVCDKIRTLELSKATLEGKASQTSVFIAYGFSIAAIIIGIVGLVR
jgi:hypothetical protein